MSYVSFSPCSSSLECQSEWASQPIWFIDSLLLQICFGFLCEQYPFGLSCSEFFLKHVYGQEGEVDLIWIRNCAQLVHHWRVSSLGLWKEPREDYLGRWFPVASYVLLTDYFLQAWLPCSLWRTTYIWLQERRFLLFRIVIFKKLSTELSKFIMLVLLQHIRHHFEDAFVF